MRNFLISLTVVIVVLLTFLSASANSTFIPIVYSDGIINPDLQPTATECEYCTPTATGVPLQTVTPTIEPTVTPTIEPTVTPTIEPTVTPSGITLEKYANGKHHFGLVVNNSSSNAMVSITMEDKTQVLWYDLYKPETIDDTLLMHPGERICYSYYMVDTIHDMGVKVDRVTYYTKNYFGYDVRLESVSIKDNSLLVTLHNYDDYNAYGKVYVSLYDEQDNLWNCVTTMYGATIQPNETTALTLPELYPNGYQFIKQYTAYVFAN